MNPALIPQPHSLKKGKGFFHLPASGTIGISTNKLFLVAKRAMTLFKGSVVVTSFSGTASTLWIVLRDGIKTGGYRLLITSKGIVIQAESVVAASYGLQTLLQINSQCSDGRLQALKIDDWPDFTERGIYYDVTRGRVPKIERLMEQIDLLSAHKINHYQLYIEHVFKFAGHPEIGKGASPLTPDDIRKLDAHCRKRNVELIPSLASFGHMSNVLKHPRYRRFAEDWGIGKYLSPEAGKLQPWQRHKGWTLSPANPDVYKFLDSLFSEFLPLFTSDRFNVCCDETWDLGLGQSYKLCLKKGKGRVYLDHILKLRNLAAKYGKRIMFWSDMIRHYPELIKEVPDDVTILDWGYNFNEDFDRLRDLKKSRLDFFACPGTSSWVAPFPRLHEAMANIHGFAAAARKHGARGLLTTDWGDGGHGNFMENSWHGYLFAAEQAWNVNADRKDFTRRFCKLFMGIDELGFARAIEGLGDVVHLQFARYYQSFWSHVFFAKPDDDVFRQKEDAAYVCKNGKISRVRLVPDAKLGRATLKRMMKIRNAIAARTGKRGADLRRILPYWLFAADTLLHATRKMAAFGNDGENTPATRHALKKEMIALMKRFRKLWLARNRTSEIEITLKRYRRVIDAL